MSGEERLKGSVSQGRRGLSRHGSRSGSRVERGSQNSHYVPAVLSNDAPTNTSVA